MENKLDEIKNTTLLLKYLDYLISFSGNLIEKEDMNEADYQSLSVENNLFMKRVENSKIIPDLLKKELLLNTLPGSTTSSSSFFRLLKFFL